MAQDTNIDCICCEQWKAVTFAFRKASLFPKFSANNNFLCTMYFSYPHHYFQFTTITYFNDSLIQASNNLLHLYYNVHQLQCKFALKANSVSNRHYRDNNIHHFFVKDSGLGTHTQI